MTTTGARLCRLIAVCGYALMLYSCSNIDCELNNAIYANYEFYDRTTNSSYSLPDTLTVEACGTDSILYNRGYNLNSLSLPVSYAQQADTLLFCISGESAKAVDTLIISHSNEPHFESVNCGTTIFHTIRSVQWTTDESRKGIPQIDSVAILNAKIDYDEKTHFRIYFRTL